MRFRRGRNRDPSKKALTESLSYRQGPPDLSCLVDSRDCPDSQTLRPCRAVCGRWLRTSLLPWQAARLPEPLVLPDKAGQADRPELRTLSQVQPGEEDTAGIG